MMTERVPLIARAAVIAAPGQVELLETRVGAPGPGQVRVRLEGCGVCASNLPVWEGKPWFEYPQEPGAPGHEGWGVIDAVGPGVEGFTEGDRVGVLSYHAFAEYDLADASAVVRLPAALGDRPFPAEPLGCAVNVFRRSGIAAGQTVAVIGVGFLGALLVALAHRAGARVIAISRREVSLAIARRFGADEIIAMDDHQAIIDRVHHLTGGTECPVVIEAAGKQWPLDLAAELTAERGRLVVAGYHQDGPRQVNMQLWNWRGIDVINAHERDARVYTAGMQAAVELVASGAIDPAPLYTHLFPLERIADAFQTAAERPDDFMKALVVL